MKLPFKPWLDQAGSFSISHIGGIPHYNTPVKLSAPRAGVLHTTELIWSKSLAIFRSHFAPHFMVGYDDESKEVRIAQLVQVGTIGAALKAHNNKALVQIEMIGFSKSVPWLPDDKTLEAVASLMAICQVEYGIPLTHPWPDGDFGKAGPNPHRTSGNFGSVAGWFGHGDCPSPDIHWDPGNLEWSKLFARAQTIANGLGGAPQSIGPMAMAGMHNWINAHYLQTSHKKPAGKRKAEGAD
jgi:hypothetical protein